MRHRATFRGLFCLTTLLTAVAGASVTGGCASDADLGGFAGERTETDKAALFNQSVTFVVLDTGDIANDGYDFSDLTERKEHCYVSATLASSFPAGTQIRIATGNHLGLCTVQHNAAGPTCPGGVTPCYRVGVHSQLAVRRLGMSSTLGATAVGTASDEAVSGTIGVAEHQSWPTSFTSVNPSDDVFEYRINPATALVAYTAPHGRIESDTSTQVDLILEDSDPDGRNAGWVATYGTLAGSHADHFHITSADLSETSFPDLGQLFALASLRYAVAFHGFDETNPDYTFDDPAPAGQTCDTVADKCAHVLVGGDEELLFRRGVAELLNEAFPADRRARAEGFAAPLWGTDDENFVNRLAVGGLGLQLEQSADVRTNHRTTIANTVQSVYDCLIDPPDLARVTAANGGSVSSGGTGYATTTSSLRCPRFIAEIAPTTPNVAYTFNAGIHACSGAGSAHVDYYRWSLSLQRWHRIGGGRINYSASCVATKVGFTEPTGTAAQAGVFRAVVRASSSAGTAQQAFFTVAP